MDRDCYNYSGVRFRTSDYRDVLFITLDVDWAPEKMLNETVNFFSEKGIPITIFATHKSRFLNRLYAENVHEIGIHPNITRSVERQYLRKEIKKLKELYPRAVGVRSHSLWQSTVLSFIFKELGFVYETNTLLPVHWKCRPFIDWTGIVKLPFIWEDDTALYMGNLKSGFKALKNNGLKILNIHPIHFYLNTCSLEEYQRNKEKVKRVRTTLKKYINTKQYGVRDFVEDFVSRSRGYKFKCLREIVNLKS